MTETTTPAEQETAERAADMARLWDVANEARALARTFSDAEEALDALDETDPPPVAERTALDDDDSMVAPSDPMPPLHEGTVEEEPAGAAPNISWGVLARLGMAVATAVLVGWAGARLLHGAPAPGGLTAWPPFVLWLPGVLVSSAVSGAAAGLRRTSASVPSSPGRTRTAVRWAGFAVTVFVLGSLVLCAVLSLWVLGLTGGDPALACLGAAVGLAAVLAQVPARAPGPVAWVAPGAVFEVAAERFGTSRRRRRDRHTAKQWRRARSRARTAIRAHTEAWQAVHQRCHVEQELGNPQAQQLAEALFVLRGSMFGRELPGDSETAPGVPLLLGNLEVAVHSLTVYHPDRLTRRLRGMTDAVREESS